MKVSRDNGALIVEESPVVVPVVFGASAIVLLVPAVLISLGLYEHEQPAWAALLVALLSTAIAVVFLCRDHNRFDSQSGQLTWSKRTLFGTSGGTVPFQDITSITIETQSTSETIPSARIVVHTPSVVVPLTRHYSGSVASHEPLAALLRGAVELANDRLIEDSLKALVQAGRKIDAVRLLRLKEGIGLTEAKERVDRLAKPTADRD